MVQFPSFVPQVLLKLNFYRFAALPCSKFLQVSFLNRCITEDECPQKPDMVNNLRVQDITPTSVVIAFNHTPTADSYAVIINYTRDAPEEDTLILNVTEPTSRILYNISQLTPGMHLKVVR